VIRNNSTETNQIRNETESLQTNYSTYPFSYGFRPPIPFPKHLPQTKSLAWDNFSSDFLISNAQAYTMAAVAAASIHSSITPSIHSALPSFKSKIELGDSKQANDSILTTNNASYLNSSVNCSSVSSGYSSTCDETPIVNGSMTSSNADTKNQKSNIPTTNGQASNDQLKNEYDNKIDDTKLQKHQIGENSECSANLGNIINWIRNGSTLSPENLIDLSTKVFFLANRWARSQRNLTALSLADQNKLLSENMNELFLLQIAETKSIVNESNIKYLR
jgi:hypothetical protein